MESYDNLSRSEELNIIIKLLDNSERKVSISGSRKISELKEMVISSLGLLIGTFFRQENTHDFQWKDFRR